jgi:hypothetical protein
MKSERDFTKFYLRSLPVEVQTRSEENGIEIYSSVEEAMNAAREDPSIWKISFPVGADRIRLIRKNNEWVYESLIEEVRRKLAIHGIEYGMVYETTH